MKFAKNVSEKDKLKRVSRQLEANEKLLANHPHIKDDLQIVKATLRSFNKQMEWSLSGSAARLLIVFRTALEGQEMAKSKTGFLGPDLHRMQMTLAQFMHHSLQPKEKEAAALLLPFIQVMTIGAVYIATQLLGNWKRLFPQHDPAAAHKAGVLLRELGITFVLGSKVAESAFRSVAQGLDFTEASQKNVVDLGMCYLMLILILIDEEDNQEHEEFVENVKRFIRPHLETVEGTLKNAQEQGLMDEVQTQTALQQVEIIRHAIEDDTVQDLGQVIANALEALELPYREIKRDINQMKLMCSQLNESFRNIFYNADMAGTTISQVA